MEEESGRGRAVLLLRRRRELGAARVGGWLQIPGQPVCHACDRDRGGPAGDDREHRVTAARLVLSETPAPAWAGHGAEPATRYWLDGYLADAFPW
jgi:hypothetical protein